MSKMLLNSTDHSKSFLIEEIELQFETSQFESCAQSIERFLEGMEWQLSTFEKAKILYLKAGLLDRRGLEVEADRSFLQAEYLDPISYPSPQRHKQSKFESEIRQALESLPEVFQPYIKNIQILIQDYPGKETLDKHLLGLYEGIPRTERTPDEEDHLDRVFIYKRNHEIQFPNESLFEEIQKTTIHEIGHHFGLEDHQMGYFK